MKQSAPLKSESASELPDDLPLTGEYCFGGFKNLNSTPIPDEFFDLLAVQLCEAELRVLLYIMRRTFGFKKKADAISLSQLTGGIRKRDGSVLDYGTGLSKPSVLKAVGGLQAKGIITIEKRTGEDGRNEINVYQLRFSDETGVIPTRPGLSQPVNSVIEYSNNEQVTSFPPDPRFVSARLAGPFAGTRPGPEKNSGPSGGQRQAGEFSGPAMPGLLQENRLPEGVNQFNHGGKLTLPGAKTNSGMCKLALPGEVNLVNRDSQAGPTTRVNQVNRQHGSLQNYSKQVTETQTVWRASNALAVQAVIQNEPVAPNPAEDELYISIQELVEAMVELGLSEKLAFDLIRAYPPEYLWEKVKFTRRQLAGHSHQRLVKNVAGYLRRAIADDYRPSPANSARNTLTGTAGFANRFPAALALLNKSQPESSQPPAANSSSLEVENEAIEEEIIEDEPFYPEETAPLPPIYRQGSHSHAMPGESLSGRPPTPPLHSRGVSAPPSGGAVRVSEFSHPTSVTSISQPEPGEGLTGLWQKIYEDLEGRFRLGEALELLKGAQLYLPTPDDQENYVSVRLNSPWQERALGLTARSAVAMAIRQRLGPGFKVTFCSA